ncbi:hypothetical protein [Haloferula sp. BvORR071]|uniref:hypothetical protein n=1 Tax=Haloferula sp. BvORR071 TaxID=1396141 RepID=UPI00224104EC|nr:hypothetical protein [Haloferula sp. BvORR071]
MGFLVPLVGIAPAAPPAWWADGSSPILQDGMIPDNKGVANLGQAKWMAHRALQTIHMYAPTLADQIEGDLVGAGKPIPSWAEPVDDAGRLLQRSPLLIGQLKAITAPFYTRINAVIPSWLAAERLANGTETGDGIFPWTNTNAADDNNKGFATIGQLKASFAFHLTESADGDTLPDFYEWIMNGGTSGPGSGVDKDGDGWLDSAEVTAGGNPFKKDNPKVKLVVVVSGN